MRPLEHVPVEHLEGHGGGPLADGVAPAIDLGDDVRWGRVDVVDESGRVVRTIEPEFGNAGGMRECLGTIPVRVSGGR